MRLTQNNTTISLSLNLHEMRDNIELKLNHALKSGK